MGNVKFLRRGERQRTIVQLLESLTGRHSKWEIWQDFIIMSAISIANVFDSLHREQREKLYLEHAHKYSTPELEIFSQMLCEVIDEMEQNPHQDLLGELFMMLELGNEWKGQFFTPYSVCRAMAAMNLSSNLQEQLNQNGWISVCDPACGAGALLIAFAHECQLRDINYQTSVLFVAQDIDFLAGCMCYIQLSLLGCPGYVVIDNTLTNPVQCYDEKGLIPKEGSNVWYTPMYFGGIWHWRRFFAQLT